MDSMDLTYFYPYRVDNLGMFFQNEEEKNKFISSLDEETRHYIVNHADEFHCKEELEVVALKMGKKD